MSSYITNKKQIMLPVLHKIAGGIALTGFILAAVNSFVLAIDVLESYRFIVISILCSFLVSVLILFFLFTSDNYRSVMWEKKWPVATLSVALLVIMGSAMVINSIGHMVNYYASQGKVYAVKGEVRYKTRIGPRNTIPHITINIGEYSGEKRVGMKTWEKYDIGDTVIVYLRNGYLGYVNIMEIR